MLVVRSFITDMPQEVLPEVETFARIKVAGIGGGGGAAIERMIKSNVQGIEFIAINTDAQALHHSHAPRKLHIGKETTRGLGAGADPEVGRKAAEESEKEIYGTLKGADMVFITSGEGGGTGTGSAPLIAAAAREMGALVVAIVTKPFSFEGERRRRSADAGIEELKDNVDTLITIPNDRLLQMIDRKTSLLDAFRVVDEVLQQGVQGISDLITIHGLINLDFADIKAIMSNAGSALMGIGKASGENRAVEAARQAIDSPLLEVSIDGAKGVLMNISGGRNMSMHEIDEAAKTITAAVDPEANIIFGAVLDESLEDTIKITVVATGFEIGNKPREHHELPAQKPVFERPTTTVMPPDLRRPFIDEKPRVPVAEPEPVTPMRQEEPAPEPEPIVSPSPLRHRTLASIEPDPEEATASEDVFEPTAKAPVAESDSAAGQEARVLPGSSVGVPGLEDDDLDIPAFIRRKVE
jgi:cell division protein FtsZ